jgi:acetyl/propionyl-CoA carboxylase alpha subunit
VVKLGIQGAAEDFRAEITEDNSASGEFSVTLHREVGSKSYSVRLLSRSGDRYTLEIDGRIEDFLLLPDGDKVLVNHGDQVWPFEITSSRKRSSRGARSVGIGGHSISRAQMPGRVVQLLRKTGDKVDAGEGIVIVEAMKMQNEIVSPKTGTVIRCNLTEGESVNTGDLLFEIE